MAVAVRHLRSACSYASRNAFGHWSVRVIDIEYSRTGAADAHDDTAPTLIGNAFAVDQAGRDVDEVPGVDVRDVVPVLQHHAAIGDVGIGGVVTVVMPSGGGAPWELREPGPDPVVGERLAPRHAFCLLDARLGEFFLGHDLRFMHAQNMTLAQRRNHPKQ